MTVPRYVIKLGEELQTKFGPAVPLSVAGQKVLAFPEMVDPRDGESLSRRHHTFLYPEDGDIDGKFCLKPGPTLPGWDYLGVCSGPVGHDPWAPETNVVEFPRQRRRRTKETNEPSGNAPRTRR